MPKVPERFERIDALFVQNASSFSSDGKTMTLHRLADATIYFADRPLREAGQVLSRRFVELWDEDDASGFAAAAPTAVLAFVEGADGGEPPADTVVSLAAPRLEGGELTYEVRVLAGSLPRKGGACTLFIDTFGRPLTAVSAPGAVGVRP
jgi:hypothetical protein